MPPAPSPMPCRCSSAPEQSTLVTVAPCEQKNELPGAEIAQHLARHGLNVEFKALVAPDTDVPNTILSYAANSSTDFIVMGGYGHSRLREFILGGATRGMLESADGAHAHGSLNVTPMAREGGEQQSLPSYRCHCLRTKNAANCHEQSGAAGQIDTCFKIHEQKANRTHGRQR